MTAPDPARAFGQRDFERSLVETIVEACPDGILVVDGRGVIASHNLRLFEVFGIAPEEFPGGRDGDLSGQADAPLLSRVLDLVKDPEPFLQRVRELYADPTLDDLTEVEWHDGRTLERHSRSLWSPDGVCLGRVWFFRDITARKQVERTLKELSHRDPLTGVANRRHFFERADEEVSRSRRFGRPLSCIMFDIDHFKEINDRWGHAAGDRVLVDLCASLEPILRQEDVFARVGGEEFALLLPDTDGQGAFVLSERIREKLAAGSCGDIRYAISAGVAELMPDDASAKRTLQRADVALYGAKDAGRNRTHRWRAADS